MRFIFGLFGLVLMIALMQTAVSPKTNYSHMSDGGWLAMHPDGTYTTYSPSHPAPAAPAPTAPGWDI